LGSPLHPNRRLQLARMDDGSNNSYMAARS